MEWRYLLVTQAAPDRQTMNAKSTSISLPCLGYFLEITRKIKTSSRRIESDRGKSKKEKTKHGQKKKEL